MAALIIMMIIALKAPFEIFTVTAPRTVSSTYAQVARDVQIMCNRSSACHVQHVCHVVRRDSSATKFDRVEIASILALFYWLKPLTAEGGEETGVPGENP